MIQPEPAGSKFRAGPEYDRIFDRMPGVHGPIMSLAGLTRRGSLLIARTPRPWREECRGSECSVGTCR
eukprot:764623-Hanusia_phi.AAC.3